MGFKLIDNSAPLPFELVDGEMRVHIGDSILSTRAEGLKGLSMPLQSNSMYPDELAGYLYNDKYMASFRKDGSGVVLTKQGELFTPFSFDPSFVKGIKVIEKLSLLIEGDPENRLPWTIMEYDGNYIISSQHMSHYATIKESNNEAFFIEMASPIMFSPMLQYTTQGIFAFSSTNKPIKLIGEVVKVDKVFHCVSVERELEILGGA